MILRRGSVLGVFLLTFIYSVPPAHAQSQGVPSRIAVLQAQVDQALATIAQLQAALATETSARQASDAALGATIGGQQGGAVTPAQLNQAIAAEAAARSAADTVLSGDIAAEAAAREAAIGPLSALVPLSQFVSVSTATINDLAGPHVIFNGVNVHIRNGIQSGNSFSENGKGNLIVGYNERSGADPAERGGSHNVVVGGYHRYNFGVGFVMGYANRLGGDGASVSGGAFNDAGNEFATVSAGSHNQALGLFSSVSGGDSNIASGSTASVTAGQSNTAEGDGASVTGGMANLAGALYTTVTGGANKVNNVPFTVVP